VNPEDVPEEFKRGWLLGTGEERTRCVNLTLRAAKDVRKLHMKEPSRSWKKFYRKMVETLEMVAQLMNIDPYADLDKEDEKGDQSQE